MQFFLHLSGSVKFRYGNVFTCLLERGSAPKQVMMGRPNSISQVGNCGCQAPIHPNGSFGGSKRGYNISIKGTCIFPSKSCHESITWIFSSAITENPFAKEEHPLPEGQTQSPKGNPRAPMAVGANPKPQGESLCPKVNPFAQGGYLFT